MHQYVLFSSSVRFDIWGELWNKKCLVPPVHLLTYHPTGDFKHNTLQSFDWSLHI